MRLHGGRNGDMVGRGLVMSMRVVDLVSPPMGVPLPGFIKGSQVGFTRVLVDYVFESLTCT